MASYPPRCSCLLGPRWIRNDFSVSKFTDTTWRLNFNEILASEAAYINSKLCLKVVRLVIMFNEGYFWGEGVLFKSVMICVLLSFVF